MARNDLWEDFLVNKRPEESCNYIAISKIMKYFKKEKKT